MSSILSLENETAFYRNSVASSWDISTFFVKFCLITRYHVNISVH